MGDEQGVPIRPPAIAELQVDSVDRYRLSPESFINYWNQEAPQTPVDYTVDARQALLSGYFTRIAVSELQLQFKTPNINPRNNLFAWKLYYDDAITGNQVLYTANTYCNTGVIFGVLPTGFTNAEVLGISMQVIMNQWLDDSGAYPTYIINSDLVSTAGVNNEYLELTVSGLDNPAISFVEPSLFISSGFPLTSPGTINPCLGYLPLYASTLSSFQVDAYTPTNLAQIVAKNYKTSGITWFNINSSTATQSYALTTNLAYTNYIDIVSHALCKFSRVKDSSSKQYNGQNDVLARVFLNPFNTANRFVGTSPQTLTLDYTTPKHIRWNPEEYINAFDIAMYDEYGDFLYWDYNYATEFQMTIQASET